MEPILISLSVCVVGVMAAVSLFSVAMRGREEEEEAQPSGGLPPSPTGKFFLEESPGPEARPHPSTEALLLQLERHFRLEQRAAASFLEGPSMESLHAPSPSPLRD